MGLFREEAYLAKGWYHVIVKAINSGSGIVAINDVKVGVGNVFMIAGQSNASGITESGGVAPLLPTDVAYDCVVTNNWLGNCDWKTSPTPAYIPYPLFPSFSKLTSGGKIAPNGYNIWAYSRLGNSQVDGTGGPVAFFNTASQGTDINSWKTSSDGGSVSGIPFIGWPCSGTMPNNSGLPYKRLKQSLNYYGGLFGTRAVLWHQGEAETVHKQSDPTYNSDYTNKLNYVISKSQTDFGYSVPWFVSTSATLIGSYNSSTSTWSGITESTIQSNQGTVASSNAYGASTDGIGINYRHPSDKTHLNDNSSYKGLTALADSWYTNMGTSGSGIAPQTLPSVTMTYNSGTDTYTAYAPSGYSDYKWVNGNSDLDRGVGAGSSGYSMALAGAGVRCWVKNSSGNWSLTPIVYAQSCRSGARMGVLDPLSEKTDAEISYNLNVYPNPGIGNLQIRFDMPEPSQVQVNLINQNGQVLQNIVSNYHAKGTFTYPLNVTGLSEGIYLCQLKAGDISIIKRIIVKK